MKAIYPKIYATFQGKFVKEPWKWGSKEEYYRFVTDDGEIIEQNHFSSNGGTPKAVKREWGKLCKNEGYNKVITEHGLMPIGTRVKLYIKKNKWCFRHMGE